ncbi:MAG: hypothetical protein IJ872_05860 [Eubacterium sp.]|nr:hypothetical protein [Eubacterium sp.]
MKALNTIQTISKIAKVISKIIFICSIVGLCLCIAGIISLAIGTEGLKLGGVTIQGILQDKGDISDGTLYAGLARAIVYCIGTIFISKFSELYFKKELEAGTPFTFDGAKEMLRLGILSVCITIGQEIIASIVYSVISNTHTDVAPMSEIDASGGVATGIALIVISLICKYGAELIHNKTEENNENISA